MRHAPELQSGSHGTGSHPGSHRMGGALLAVLWVLSGGGAVADPLPSVREIRVGTHGDFDRLVIELESPAEVVRRPVRGGPWLLLEISARPRAPRQLLQALPRMSDVVIEQVGRVMEVRVGAPAPRARVFLLEDPFRLVIDVADPSPKPFPVPDGATSILEEAEEELGAGEGFPERAEVSRAPGAMPGPDEPEAGSVTPERAPPVDTAAERAPPPPPAPTGEPIATRPPAPVADAAARPEPAGEPPGLFADPDSRRVSLFALAALLLAVAAVWLGMRRGASRRRRASSVRRESTEPRSAESIHPDEILAATDRVDLLEKRIDEEVRQRMHVQQSLGEIQEHLKVMRDRLNKLAGRS